MLTQSALIWLVESWELSAGVCVCVCGVCGGVGVCVFVWVIYVFICKHLFSTISLSNYMAENTTGEL